jgi:hypothetical protein
MSDRMTLGARGPAPSPACGGGGGGGNWCLPFGSRKSPLPIAFANASAIDLPRKRER